MPKQKKIIDNSEKLQGDQKSQEENEVVEQLKKMSFTYVNASAVTGTNWDVRIALGDRTPSGHVEPKVAVVMSHQHAKAFLLILAGIVKNLEEKLGHEIEVLKS